MPETEGHKLMFHVNDKTIGEIYVAPSIDLLPIANNDMIRILLLNTSELSTIY